MTSNDSGRSSIIGMSSIREGPDTERISNFEWCLLDHLNLSLKTHYGGPVRLIGHMFHFGGMWEELVDSFDGKVLYYSKSSRVHTETVISKTTWNALSDVEIKQLLANSIDRAMTRVVAHLRKKSIPFDSDSFLSDLREGLREFLTSDCSESIAHARDVKSGTAPYVDSRTRLIKEPNEQ